MGLKEGTLESLVETGVDASAVANSVFPQMLQALDCIAWKGIVHRDVKPENILYISQPGGQYQFQLGDFGLCNRIVDAATFAGSRLYMPPEMFQEGDQTHKVDVWSLFVTMLWILDAGKFRQRSNKFKTVAEVGRAVLSVASTVDSVSKIREMAIVNPEERASAAQMLVKYFDGRTQHSTESGPSSHHQSFSHCRQRSAPSSFLPDNSDSTTKTEKLANECEYICSRLPCRESA
jgi:serine/threonine protein kinase